MVKCSTAEQIVQPHSSIYLSTQVQPIIELSPLGPLKRSVHRKPLLQTGSFTQAIREAKTTSKGLDGTC